MFADKLDGALPDGHDGRLVDEAVLSPPQVESVSASQLASLPVAAVRERIESAFAGLPKGRSVAAAQTSVFVNDGDCIFYPGVFGNLIGVKVSPFLPALARSGQPPVSAYTLLVSSETGRPVLLCDSLALTTMRTAATTALAVDLLTAPSVRRLAVIGSGPIAREHLRHVTDVRDFQTIRVFSPAVADPESARHSDRVRELGELGLDLDICPTVGDAVADCEVVLLCTSSAVPVIDTAQLAPDVLLTSITTSGPDATEIAPEALNEFAVFCDVAETAMVTAAEFRMGSEAGIWSSEALRADLPALLNGADAPHSGRRYFRSTGLGIEDIAIASILLDQRPAT